MSQTVESLSAKWNPKVRAIIAVLAGLLVLIAVNGSIMQREQLLSDGQLVLLELAPVDPRSLMQGDYMALRFKITDEAFPNSRWGLRAQTNGGVERDYPADGHLVVTMDEHGVGHFQRIAGKAEVRKGGEVLLRYRVRNDQVKFATNAYFFEEGQAHTYDQARYGAFRVAANGDMILTAMHGVDYAVLKNQVVDKVPFTN